MNFGSMRPATSNGKVQGLQCCMVLVKILSKQTPPLHCFCSTRRKLSQRHPLDTLTNQQEAKRSQCVSVYLLQFCVGGYSLAAVTLAGTLAKAPMSVLATHWYLPSVTLESEGMKRLLGVSTTPKCPSISSWPLRCQLRLAEGGRALQRRFTLPPNFWTTDMGSSVNTGTSSDGKKAAISNFIKLRFWPAVLYLLLHLRLWNYQKLGIFTWKITWTIHWLAVRMMKCFFWLSHITILHHITIPLFFLV